MCRVHVVLSKIFEAIPHALQFNLFALLVIGRINIKVINRIPENLNVIVIAIVSAIRFAGAGRFLFIIDWRQGNEKAPRHLLFDLIAR